MHLSAAVHRHFLHDQVRVANDAAALQPAHTDYAKILDVRDTTCKLRQLWQGHYGVSLPELPLFLGGDKGRVQGQGGVNGSGRI